MSLVRFQFWPKKMNPKTKVLGFFLASKKANGICPCDGIEIGDEAVASPECELQLANEGFGVSPRPNRTPKSQGPKTKFWEWRDGTRF